MRASLTEKSGPFGTEIRSDATVPPVSSRVDRHAGNANVRPTQETPNAGHDPRFHGVPRHIHDRSHAERVLGREPRAKISRLRSGTRARASEAGHYPEGSRG